MPYRTQDQLHRCTECKEPTDVSCARCGRPLCQWHVPPHGERCWSCETHFEELKATLKPTEATIEKYQRTGGAIDVVSRYLSYGAVAVVSAHAYWLDTGVLILVAAGCSILSLAGTILTRKKGFFAAESIERRALRRGRMRFLKENKVAHQLPGKAPSST